MMHEAKKPEIWHTNDTGPRIRALEDQVASLQARLQNYRERVMKLERKVANLEKQTGRDLFDEALAAADDGWDN